MQKSKVRYLTKFAIFRQKLNLILSDRTQTRRFKVFDYGGSIADHENFGFNWNQLELNGIFLNLWQKKAESRSFKVSKNVRLNENDENIGFRRNQLELNGISLNFQLKWAEICYPQTSQFGDLIYNDENVIYERTQFESDVNLQKFFRFPSFITVTCPLFQPDAP